MQCFRIYRDVHVLQLNKSESLFLAAKFGLDIGIDSASEGCPFRSDSIIIYFSASCFYGSEKC